MANFLKSLFIKGVEIDTAGASSGDVLSYNGTKFAPAVPGTGSLALNDLSDAVVSSSAEFQTLQYDGTNWVNNYSPVVSAVRNAEATTLTTGTCVYLFGATGDQATVKRADNSSDTTSSKTVGVVGASITASNVGPVVTRGYVDGIDLSVGYTAGDILWLGTSGTFTKTKPTAPTHLVFIGVVVRATNNGIIYVATQNGYELDEIHNVSLPSPQSGEFLKYNGSLWVADAIDLGTDTTGNYMSGISGTSPVSVSHTPSEGSSATVSLASAYGDTQNPYASKTANYFLASPNGSAGAPTFRAIVAADIPTLNQNTTGTAATVTGAAQSAITSVGTLTSLSVTGDLTVDTNVLKVDTTNNRVGVNVTSPANALDVIGRVETRAAATQDGVAIVGRSGGTSSFDVTITPTTLGADHTFTLPNVSGTAITTGNLSDITGLGTLSQNVTILGQVNASNGSGQDAITLSPRYGGTDYRVLSLTTEALSTSRTITFPNVTGTVITTGNLSSITTVGTLSSGSIPATLLTGTVASARISGSYTGITAVGTLTSNLNIDGANSANISIGDWTNPGLGNAAYSAIENSYGYLLLGAATDQRIYLRTISNDVRIGTPSSDTLIVSGSNVSITKPISTSLEISNANVYISGTSGSYFQHATNTGSGSACQWATVLGVYYLVRNTSTRADKENFQPLHGALTASMIDQIDVSMWNRKIAPGIPEVGPMAEDMDAISPFLATHGMDIDENNDIVRTPPNGISPNGWMSLLTISLQESRSRISTLEQKIVELTARLAVLESN